MHPAAEFPALLAGRTVDVAIGPASSAPLDRLVQLPFLLYEVLAVAGPDHPLADAHAQHDQVAPELVPRAVRRRRRRRRARDCCRRLGVPEQQQRIFQSDAAALEETKRSNGLAPGGGLRGRGRPGRGSAGDPGRPAACSAQGRWSAMALPRARPDRRRRPSCCASSPRRAPPRRWCAAPACISAGSSRPSTSPSGAEPAARWRSRRRRPGSARRVCGRQERVAVRQRRGHRPDQRLEAGGRGARVQPDDPPGPAPGLRHHRGERRPGRRCPSRRTAMTSTPPRTALPCRDRSSSRRQRRQVGAAEPVDDLLPRHAPPPPRPSGATSAGVSRVSEVENANVSACRVRAKARIRCRYAVA